MKQLPRLHLLLLVTAWILGFLWGPAGFFVVGGWLLAGEVLLWRLDLVQQPHRRARWRGVPSTARLGALPSYDDIRHAIDMGAHSGREFDFVMRRRLQRIAAARLSARHGIDLHREPDRARATLGEPLWRLVDPRRPVSVDRAGHGVSVRDLAAHIHRLEQL
ncbi:MAG: hypothetical protein M3P83_10080 [Actinomycetota bacterium]|nr:hypothetical protein [Actinomycetota bacterium]